MAVFTKNFWDKKGKERRERTLEVLRAYGDSTTCLLYTSSRKEVKGMEVT